MRSEGEKLRLGRGGDKKANLASWYCLGPGQGGQHQNYSDTLLPLAGHCVASTRDILWSRTEVRPAGYVCGVVQVPPLFGSTQQQGISWSLTTKVFSVGL